MMAVPSRPGPGGVLPRLIRQPDRRRTRIVAVGRLRLPKPEAFCYAYCSRGLAWDGKHEYDKAIADYNQGDRLDPNDAWAYGNLAWLQATCPTSVTATAGRRLGTPARPIK